MQHRYLNHQRLKALNQFLADIYGRGRILSDGVVPGLFYAYRLGADAWEGLAAGVDPVQSWQFLQPSQYVRFGSVLEEFAAANGIRRGADPLSSLLETRATLHRVFQYEPGSTAENRRLTSR